MTGRSLSYRQACATVLEVGMDVVDGLAMTFACTDYPIRIRNLNGWSVEAAAAILLRSSSPDEAAQERMRGKASSPDLDQNKETHAIETGDRS